MLFPVNVASTRGLWPGNPGSCKGSVSTDWPEVGKGTHENSVSTKLSQHTLEVQGPLTALLAVLVIGYCLERNELREGMEKSPLEALCWPPCSDRLIV
jgi:hypothetical protein